VAVAIAIQALRGLHSAHELKEPDGGAMGLVHRDLSPHNLMLTFDGQVKVLDFGLAKTRSQRSVTMPGFVKGKWSYMSPEQARGDRVDRRSDLYAMGLILYEALTGEVAVKIPDQADAYQAVLGAKVTRDSRIPQDLWEVLERAIEKKPEDRPRSAAELEQLLREACAPMSDLEVGRLVSGQFPERMAQLRQWEAAPTDRKPSP
jgi:serine/threonine-protein kinase